jgi:hypothetical protein
MPSLSDALTNYSQNYSSSEPIKQPNRDPSIPFAAAPTQPVRNPFLRCALPQVWQTNTDSLRQTFTTMVPQRRLYIPK